MVTGNTVPSVVPGGVRSSNGVNVWVDESAQVASMEHDDDNSSNCHHNLPPRVCVTGRADLSLAVCAGQHISVDQPVTADNGITSQHTAPRRRHTQLRANDSNSNYDETLVRSQFVDSSVCTHGDGKNDFSH